MKNQSRNIPQIGKVEWIGIRSNKEKEVTSVDSILVKKKSGLEGDHFKENLTDKRQVTLIQQEHLIAVASILGKKNIDPKFFIGKGKLNTILNLALEKKCDYIVINNDISPGQIKNIQLFKYSQKREVIINKLGLSSKHLQKKIEKLS